MTGEEFIKILKGQVMSGRTTNLDQNKARTIRSWMKKETPQYQAFRNDGGTDAEYLGKMLRKACVDKDFAWEFVQQEIGGTFDISRQDDLKAEFDYGWDKSVEDEEWAKRVFASQGA